MIYTKFTRLDGGFPLRNGIYGSYELIKLDSQRFYGFLDSVWGSLPRNLGGYNHEYKEPNVKEHSHFVDYTVHTRTS